MAREIRAGRLVAVEIVDARPLGRSLDVIHPRQRPLSPESVALLAVVRAAVSDVKKSPPRRRRAPVGTRAR